MCCGVTEFVCEMCEALNGNQNDMRRKIVGLRAFMTLHTHEKNTINLIRLGLFIHQMLSFWDSSTLFMGLQRPGKKRLPRLSGWHHAMRRSSGVIPSSPQTSWWCSGENVYFREYMIWFVFVYLSICLYISISIYIYIYIYISIYLSIYRSVCLSIYLSIYLSSRYIYISSMIVLVIYLNHKHILLSHILYSQKLYIIIYHHHHDYFCYTKIKLILLLLLLLLSLLFQFNVDIIKLVLYA